LTRKTGFPPINERLQTDISIDFRQSRFHGPEKLFLPLWLTGKTNRLGSERTCVSHSFQISGKAAPVDVPGKGHKVLVA
jgi:hypothetical protein